VSLSCLSAADRAASSMSQSMTFAPAWAKAVAIPSPMPDAAPVTNAVFPASSFTRILPVQADNLVPNAEFPRRHMTALSSGWEACRMLASGTFETRCGCRRCPFIGADRKWLVSVRTTRMTQTGHPAGFWYDTRPDPDDVGRGEEGAVWRFAQARYPFPAALP